MIHEIGVSHVLSLEVGAKDKKLESHQMSLAGVTAAHSLQEAAIRNGLREADQLARAFSSFAVTRFSGMEDSQFRRATPMRTVRP